MKQLLSSLQVQVSENLYIKNPETSELGRKILSQSISLIDSIGFENFTFKKLGEQIHSNESSVYRYFENKHKLLLYLSAWYWGWMEVRLVLITSNISNPEEKLRLAIQTVTEEITEKDTHIVMDPAVLFRIITTEFLKSYHTKEVDQENTEGFFLMYKKVINRLIASINEVNAEYPYARSLASTVVEGALHQHFLKDHLTTITDCGPKLSPAEFYTDLVFKVLSHGNKIVPTPEKQNAQ